MLRDGSLGSRHLGETKKPLRENMKTKKNTTKKTAGPVAKKNAVAPAKKTAAPVAPAKGKKGKTAPVAPAPVAVAPAPKKNAPAPVAPVARQTKKGDALELL